MNPHLIALAIALGGGSLGAWFLVYGVALVLTRPARPEPAPATQDFPGTESPAVVSLLAGYWDLSEDAAESTLVDLGARRFLEFRQPGNDPMQTTVHVREPNPAGLTPYERRVFDRVAGLAVGGVVPLPALTFRDPGQAGVFASRVRAEVIAEARSRGLSQRRFGPLILTLLHTVAIAAGAGVAGAIVLAPTRHTAGTFQGAGFAWLITATFLGGLGNRSHGERDTPAGRAIAARWLGVKAWLRGTEAFADLPPAAVAVWDRYLSYGTALGTTRVTSAVIDLGMGNRKRVWSSFGDSWHRVRVRYPRFWPRYGKKAVNVILKGLFAAALGGLLLYSWAKGFAKDLGSSQVANVAGKLTDLGLLVGLVLLGYGLYVLIRITIDLAAPRTITGQVLWREVWRQKSGSENSPPRPWLHYLAIDDGSGDRTTAWGMPSEHVGGCRDGDTVTIRVRPWTRRIIELTDVQAGTMRRVQIADQDQQNTEALISIAMGNPAPGPPGLLRAPAVAPKALLTEEEVSRAFGTAVTMRGGGSGGPIAMGAVQFQTADGQVALILMTLSGLPAQLAARARRRQQALPGIGDEAYAGDGWALARRGDTVVTLTVRGGGRGADPRSIH